MSATVPRERSLGEKLLFAVLILAVGDVAGKALGFIISVMAATRYIALYRTTKPRKSQEVAQFILLFGLCTTALATVLMIIFAPQLAKSANAPQLAGSIQLSVIVLITQTLAGLILGMLIGMERFRAASLATVMQNVVMLALPWWWAPRYGLTGTLYAMAAGFGTTLIIAAWGCRDLYFSIPLQLRRVWSHRSIIWEFCLPSLVAGIIVMPATWAATAMLAAQPGGLQQLAFFFAADQLRPILGLLTNIVSQPMMTFVASHARQAMDMTVSEEERNTARIKSQNATTRCFQLLICLVLPAHAVLAFAGPYIMAIFGRKFATEWNAFLLVLAWAAYSGITSLMGTTLQAQGRVWWCNALLVVYGILLVVFTYPLSNLGAVGLGLAYLATSVVSGFVTAAILQRLGYMTWQAVALVAMSLGWIIAVSLGAAWVPESLRLPIIPLVFAFTMLVLFATMRTQMQHVLRMFTRKAFSFLRRAY